MSVSSINSYDSHSTKLSTYRPNSPASGESSASQELSMAKIRAYKERQEEAENNAVPFTSIAHIAKGVLEELNQQDEPLYPEEHTQIRQSVTKLKDRINQDPDLNHLLPMISKINTRLLDLSPEPEYLLASSSYSTRSIHSSPSPDR